MSKLLIDNRYIKLEEIIYSKKFSLSSDEEFKNRIKASQSALLSAIESGVPIYGVNTGFGDSGRDSVENLMELQQNLYRFHGCGVGEYLECEVVRVVILLRLISLSKGVSGVSFELLERLLFLLKNCIYPLIPTKGSVGASGDLTPLSYIAATLAAETKVKYQGEIVESKNLLKSLNLDPYIFKPKEALAIMNGTSFMLGVATYWLFRFKRVLELGERFCAILYELLECDTTPLLEFVHNQKPFFGQIESAKAISCYLEDSKLAQTQEQRFKSFFENRDQNIQDRYSLRCAPQIYGVIRDTLDISHKWLEIEANSSSDNPLIDGESGRIYSGGNFYGGYVSNAMDSMRTQAGNLADLLDKQLAILVDGRFNKNLGSGLKLHSSNSSFGFKAMQITQSALCVDVISFTNPISTLSRETESLNQDKVSLGATSALKFKECVLNLELMISISLISCAQAIEIKGKSGFSKEALLLYSDIRAIVEPTYKDRAMDSDIKKVAKKYVVDSRLI